MQFRVLGPMEVLVDGVPVHLGGPRPRALLALLIAHSGRVVSTSHLIDQLWEHNPPATAQAALQVHVSTLRKVLGDRVVTVASGYRLDAEDVDVWQFERTADLDLWRGQPYCGIPTVPDIEAARVRLTELRLTTAEKRFEAELAIGGHARVVGDLTTLIAEHPLRERLVSLLMLAQYRCGRESAAHAGYRGLRERLAAEFGAQPSPQLMSLDQAIARRDPTLDPPSAIPTPPSRFIGRREELTRLADRLGEVRLLTLTGPAGVGKTRLALELARDTAVDHDALHLVELATLTTDGSVAAAVAGALDDELSSSRALLVMDNCEHVVDDCAEVVAELLGRHAGLRIVTTSREPLGVPGEQVWPVSGLAVSEAVRLLANRAASAKPGFALTELNAEIATELCVRLDGLPLAIELAAAQLRTLSLPEVAARLGQRLDLADRRARTAPNRHRTMRAAIAWSHDLLDPDERTLFARMSVFAGGCTADAVDQVCGFGPDVLAGLVDRSLVVADQQVDGTRYRMLELVREYAAEQVDDAGANRQRHATWYAEFVESTPWAGPDPRWIRRLVDEVPNLVAAVEWSLEFDVERALRILSTLWQFWWSHGLGAQARRWLRGALASPLESVPLSLRAKVWRTAATMAQSEGDHEEGRRFDELALAAFLELGDNENVACSLLGLSWSATCEGRLTEAIALIDRAERAAELAGSETYLAASWSFRGIALRGLGRWEEATELFTRAHAQYEKLGEQGGMAVALSDLGMMARWNGDPERSRSRYLDSLRLFRHLGFEAGQVDVLEGLAGTELALGRPASALRMLAVADRVRDRLPSPYLSADRFQDRSATWKSAHAELGAEAEKIVFDAGSVDLATVVADLLETPSE